MTRDRERGRGPVDWADLRSRVEAAGRALLDGENRSPEATAALLEERARALARPPVEPHPGGMVELVTFAVGGVRYGVDPAGVLEMFRSSRVVPLPGGEPWVAGLTVWRGDLVVVVDLGVLLGGRPTPRSDRPSILVLGGERSSLGLLADGPGEVETVAASELRPPPEDGDGRELISAMTSRPVLVLNLDRVLSVAGHEPADGRV